MQKVYDYLEPKYNKSKVRLDVCFWLPSDIGVFGSKHGKPIIKSYINIFKELSDSNYIMEKLHISDAVYSRIHENREVDYGKEEKILKKLNFKIILITYPEDEKILEDRIKGRLAIYPHYKNILQAKEFYFKQRRQYLKQVEQSILPHTIIETRKLPDEKPVKDILQWIGEDDA